MARLLRSREIVVYFQKVEQSPAAKQKEGARLTDNKAPEEGKGILKRIHKTCGKLKPLPQIKRNPQKHRDPASCSPQTLPRPKAAKIG